RWRCRHLPALSESLKSARIRQADRRYEGVPEAGAAPVHGVGPLPTSPRLLQHRHRYREAALPDFFPVCLRIGLGPTIVIKIRRMRVSEAADQLAGDPLPPRCLT